MSDLLVKCSWCKHIHFKANRVYTEKDKYGIRYLVCPKCGAKSFGLVEDVDLPDGRGMVDVLDIDRAESAYWRFDARVRGYSEWKCQPQSERDAFKAEYREAESHNNARIAELEAKIAELEADKRRIDWLADKNQSIGNVMLPTQCVVANMDDLRAAIDMAMEIKSE